MCTCMYISIYQNFIEIFTGRALMKFPVFAKAIQKCDTVLRPLYRVLLTDILTSDNKNSCNNIINLFLGLVGLQVRKKNHLFKLYNYVLHYVLLYIKYN